jgi:hypothetical protein
MTVNKTGIGLVDFPCAFDGDGRCVSEITVVVDWVAEESFGNEDQS